MLAPWHWKRIWDMSLRVYLVDRCPPSHPGSNSSLSKFWEHMIFQPYGLHWHSVPLLNDLMCVMIAWGTQRYDGIFIWGWSSCLSSCSGSQARGLNSRAVALQGIRGSPPDTRWYQSRSPTTSWSSLSYTRCLIPADQISTNGIVIIVVISVLVI